MPLALALSILASSMMNADSVAASDDNDRRLLDGTWQGYVVEGNGDNPDRGPVHLEVVIAGDKMSAKDLKSPDKSFGEGTFTLGDSEQPNTLDAMGTDGQEKGKSYRGIYSLDGDTLKWCVGNPGRPRKHPLP
jgi:uncharacterized protein (TIGR03067 family)